MWMRGTELSITEQGCTDKSVLGTDLIRGKPNHECDPRRCVTYFATHTGVTQSEMGRRRLIATL